MIRNIIIIAILLFLLTAACLLFGKVFGLPGILGIVAIFVIICGFLFYRSMRMISAISNTPEGRTIHAEFFYKNIKTGMPLIKVVQIAQALGKKIATAPDTYIWEDGQNRVTVVFEENKAANIQFVSRDEIEKAAPASIQEPIVNQ